jgi:hypothetical protein
MRIQLIALCAILLFLLKAPNVMAQTTTITRVSYTKTALFDIDTQRPNPPLIVNATVGYGDAKPGDYLIVGVFDLDSGNLVTGLGSSSPQSCSTTTQSAGCLIPLNKERGSERMQFSLEHPQVVWNLALIAALLDNAAHPIPNSYSDYTFTITVKSALTLSIDVPLSVPVNVDGVNGSGGDVQLVLAAGNHTVSVPQLVSVSNVTRLRFLDWSDGSTAANRTVELNYDITLNANYVTQYYLDIVSPVNVTGAGWYDASTRATLSIPSTTQLMAGIMGIVGARWIFQGWFEGTTEISRSQTQTVTLTSPQTIIVEWAPDYTVPLITLGIAVMLSAGTFYVKRKKSIAGRPRRRVRSRARRSRLGRRSEKRESLCCVSVWVPLSLRALSQSFSLVVLKFRRSRL